MMKSDVYELQKVFLPSLVQSTFECFLLHKLPVITYFDIPSLSLYIKPRMFFYFLEVRDDEII